MITFKNPKTPKMYECKHCEFNTSNKKDYGKHLLTVKHLKYSVKPELITVKVEKPNFKCECGHSYAYSSGLCRHKVVCKYVQHTNNIQLINIEPPNTSMKHSPEEFNTLTSMVVELMKSNAVLQQQMIDICKTTSSINNSTVNSHNKTFNLQFFLNEQCKDAMNISEFASTFVLQLEDLESVGELGYVEGISKIIVDKLNAMDIYKRPMHCSDAKREIIYVKDEDIWTKEGPGTPKLRQAIKNISFQNMKLVYNWSNAYPESKDNRSQLNDTYIKLVLQSTGGNGPIIESENKIIRRIAREIVIGKHNM
jgi:hypothetical protein